MSSLLSAALCQNAPHQCKYSHCCVCLCVFLVCLRKPRNLWHLHWTLLHDWPCVRSPWMCDSLCAEVEWMQTVSPLLRWQWTGCTCNWDEGGGRSTGCYPATPLVNVPVWQGVYLSQRLCVALIHSTVVRHLNTHIVVYTPGKPLSVLTDTLVPADMVRMKSATYIC